MGGVLGLLLFLVFTGLAAFSAWNSYNQSMAIQMESIQLSNKDIATEIESYFIRITTVTNSLSKIVDDEMSLPPDQRNRVKISREINAFAKANPDIFSIGVYMEPGAFDGKDEIYKNTPFGTSTTGRLAFGSDINGDLIEVTPSLTIDQDGRNGWYKEPLASQEPIVL